MTHRDVIRKTAQKYEWLLREQAWEEMPEDSAGSGLDQFIVGDYVLYVQYAHGWQAVDASLWTQDYRCLDNVEGLSFTEKLDKVKEWLWLWGLRYYFDNTDLSAEIEKAEWVE